MQIADIPTMPQSTARDAAGSVAAARIVLPETPGAAFLRHIDAMGAKVAVKAASVETVMDAAPTQAESDDNAPDDSQLPTLPAEPRIVLRPSDRIETVEAATPDEPERTPPAPAADPSANPPPDGIAAVTVIKAPVRPKEGGAPAQPDERPDQSKAPAPPTTVAERQDPKPDASVLPGPVDGGAERMGGAAPERTAQVTATTDRTPAPPDAAPSPADRPTTPLPLAAGPVPPAVPSKTASPEQDAVPLPERVGVEGQNGVSRMTTPPQGPQIVWSSSQNQPSTPPAIENTDRLPTEPSASAPPLPTGATATHGAGPSAPAMPTASPVPAQIVVPQIAEAARALGQGPVDIALSPEELGRVRLTLNVTEQGMSVVIQADRDETLALLRRNIDMLGTALGELGFAKLDFAFSGGRDGGGKGQPGADGRPGQPAFRGGNFDGAGGAVAPVGMRAALLDRLDIRM
ncbi:hypothetical protein OCGS_2126 [Oceaniovalibus guishaninsula JLT2003]|uniref:Flagellar hook-length control protein-like C-terminal domain-containing protein n=1 Tax=Oceaniovalibus guishaninsula JLT2003 TaxID=1231392 RepID=K2HAU2_9RHOB|nr:flagellar hook-length control protein FliK [Oceaniovalibus guishaninsula]EKE43792.1 hypothetical protein OCGS_2126 [Oceaniovalibus guishaninsula JLT2003]